MIDEIELLKWIENADTVTYGMYCSQAIDVDELKNKIKELKKEYDDVSIEQAEHIDMFSD